MNILIDRPLTYGKPSSHAVERMWSYHSKHGCGMQTPSVELSTSAVLGDARDCDFRLELAKGNSVWAVQERRMREEQEMTADNRTATPLFQISMTLFIFFCGNSGICYFEDLHMGERRGLS
ncbi:hypothetical protein V6000_000491 [Aspergillus fumigatus]